MIEVRIDIEHMQKHQHNVLHSILMMEALRTAGVPVIGKIIFNGPARGTLVQHRENTLDGDDWVVRWFDDKEDINAEYPEVQEQGNGKGYSWTRYAEEDDL